MRQTPAEANQRSTPRGPAPLWGACGLLHLKILMTNTPTVPVITSTRIAAMPRSLPSVPYVSGWAAALGVPEGTKPVAVMPGCGDFLRGLVCNRAPSPHFQALFVVVVRLTRGKPLCAQSGRRGDHTRVQCHEFGRINSQAFRISLT